MSLTAKMRESRWLFLVFMILLMFVFLIGDVVGRGLRSDGQQDFRVGDAFGGEPIHVSAANRAWAALRLAGAQPLQLVPPQMVNLIGAAGDDGPLIAALLVEEAKRAGIHVGRNQVRQQIDKSGITEAGFANLRRQVHGGQLSVGLKDEYAALGEVMAALRYADVQVEAAAVESGPRLESQFKQMSQTADVELSVIMAAAFESQVGEPTEEELQAHFDKYRDVAPVGEDGTPAPFAYRQPDRVVVEYLTIDPLMLKPRIRLPDVERYYRQNWRKYAGEGVTEAPPLEQFEERVREDKRREKARRDAQRFLEQQVYPKIEAAQRAATEGDGARVDFAAIASELTGEFPVKFARTKLDSQAALSAEPGIGRAQKQFGEEILSLPELAFRVEDLFQPEEGDELPVFQLNEPGPVVYEMMMNQQTRQWEVRQAYIFRVVEIREAGPPASIDEVRARVEGDVRRAKLMEMAEVQARRLAERAREVGLEQAVGEAEELKSILAEAGAATAGDGPDAAAIANRYVEPLTPFAPTGFTRSPKPLKNVGYAPELHEKVFERLDEGVSPGTFTIEMAVLPATQRCIVAQINGMTPMYDAEFRSATDQLQQQVMFSNQRNFLMLWFNPNEVLTRTGFQPARPNTETES